VRADPRVPGPGGPELAGRRNAVPWIALAAILLLGAGLRFGCIDAGLPAVFLSDEELVTKNALSLGARRTLEPLYFEYPTFEIYLLAALYAALFVAGSLAGAYEGATDFAVRFFIDPTPVYLVGRAASAAMSLGAVVVVYLLGRRLYGARAGLFGALLLALGIESAREAALATPNAPLAFLAILAFLPIEAVARRGTLRDYLLAGATIGLSVSAKYNSGLLVIPLLVAHFGAGARRPGQWLFLALAVAAATFLLVTPYWVLSFGDYLDGYLYSSSHMRIGHVGHMGKTPVLWAVREILSQERTAALLAFAGGLLALRRRSRGDVLLLSFLVPSFLAIASLKNQQLDYLASLWPPAAILGGRALEAVLGRGPLRRSRMLATFAGSLLVAPSLLGAVGELRRARSTDTREVARDWIEKSIPSGSGIAYDKYHYEPRLLDAGRAGRSKVGRQYVGDRFAARLEEALRGLATYRLVPIIVPTDEPDLTGVVLDAPIPDSLQARIVRDRFLSRDFSSRSRSVDELIAEGAEYVLLSSQWTDRFLVAPPPPADSPLRLFWMRERTHLEGLIADPRVVEFRRWAPGAGLVGPRVTLYRIAPR